MPEQTPVFNTTLRNPRVDDDDDDDDLDDLDDVLASFNTAVPKKQSAPAAAAAASASSPKAKQPANLPPQGDEDFEASLVEGMEQLLRQLAGDHPPGPMPESTAAKSKESSASPELGALSKEEEEEAWKKAVEMMLSGEGLDALGLDANGQPKPASKSPAPSTSEPKPDFEETIRQTMEQLKAPKASAEGSNVPDLAALLAQLGSDPSALEGLGDGDDDLGGLLDGMMAQLMTKEVLQEPMGELASKYPAYLASPPAGTSAEDLTTYRKQYELVKVIDETFGKDDYSDDKDGKEIARLVGEMQDLGGPPKEIMGDMPEGFDLGALGGNDEACTIM